VDLPLAILPPDCPQVLADLAYVERGAPLGVVIAEMFLDPTGVGGLIATAASYFHTAEMLAGVIVFGAMGILMMSGLSRIEARLSGWKGLRDG
jgi:sulfonate transport system permease protein